MSYFCYLPAFAAGVLFTYLTPRLLKFVVGLLLSRKATRLVKDVKVKSHLRDHTKEFDKSVHKVGVKIYVSLARCHWRFSKLNRLHYARGRDSTAVTLFQWDSSLWAWIRLDQQHREDLLKFRPFK